MDPTDVASLVVATLSFVVSAGSAGLAYLTLAPRRRITHGVRRAFRTDPRAFTTHAGQPFLAEYYLCYDGLSDLRPGDFDNRTLTITFRQPIVGDLTDTWVRERIDYTIDPSSTRLEIRPSTLKRRVTYRFLLLLDGDVENLRELRTDFVSNVANVREREVHWPDLRPNRLSAGVAYVTSILGGATGFVLGLGLLGGTPTIGLILLTAALPPAALGVSLSARPR